VGHPQELRLNFEVNYLSGIILTKAPSIVETTDKAHQGGPPALAESQFGVVEIQSFANITAVSKVSEIAVAVKIRRIRDTI
jgi:hypothetical protein